MSRRGENIHKRKDGRWEGRYIKDYDINGKAKYGSVYSKSYLEVKKKLNEKKYETATHALSQKDRHISFGEVLYLWLDNNHIHLKEQTYSKYKRLIDTHIIPQIGSVDIKKITSIFINKFLYEKAEKGRLDGSGGLSGSYVKTISFVLNSSLKFASREGFCTAAECNMHIPLSKSSQLDVLSVTEQRKLEEYILNNLNEKDLGVLISLYAGLRIGEVCALKWEDINIEEKTIHIKHSICRINVSKANSAKTKLLISDVKTNSSNRIIPITDKLCSILFYFRNNQNDFILHGKSYPYTDPRVLQYSFHKTLRDCGLRHINFHTLRHTFATRCIESGMDVKSLSEIMGHSNVNITLNTYVHSSLNLKRKQLEAMVSFCGQ